VNFTTFDHLWQLIVSVEPTPAFLRALDKPEHHCKCGLRTSPIRALAARVADARLAYLHRTNAGHDLKLRQMPGADALATFLGLESRMPLQEVGDLRLDGLCR
jgi:hypothetical protein